MSGVSFLLKATMVTTKPPFYQNALIGRWDWILCGTPKSSTAASTSTIPQQPCCAEPSIITVLGVADEQLLADAFDAVQAGDARGALLTVARCSEGGRDAGSFTRDLEGRARELLVVQTLGDVPPELSLTPEIDTTQRNRSG